MTGTPSSTSASDASSSQVTIVIPGAPSPTQVGSGGTTQGVVTTTIDASVTTVASGSASNTAIPNASGAARKTNAGAIAGGVLGALILLVLIFFAVVFVRRRQRRRFAPSAEFLDRSFQPLFMENPSYAFGSSSPYATSSSHQSPMSHTPNRPAYPLTQHNP
ncbi:hypothetical protein FPV67DRAFT_34932 [Lyophyllum atratum]|nr:hypothetical protein FPV67DRAFT_34932 [Lyophyllum atratum]